MMYFKIVFVLGFFLCSAQLLSAGNSSVNFKIFQKNFHKTYQTTELTLREQIYNDNLKKIEEHNKNYELGLVTFKAGVNAFTDLTEEEFSSRFKTLPIDQSLLEASPLQDSNQFNISDLPESIDWREKGMVTKVKNQGLCGACWAFSATGTLEGQLAKNTGNLTSLSEQDLLDCNGQSGCNGGIVQSAIVYVAQNGITSEDKYPYSGSKGTCKNNKKAVTADGYINIRTYNETDLQLAVGFVGPISVAVNAALLQNYESGIISENCSDAVDHGVLAVGYGTDNATNMTYWIIKNSWGDTWGENGYYRLAMGVGNGLCGIAKQACYPVGVRSGSEGVGFSILAVMLIFVNFFLRIVKLE